MMNKTPTKELPVCFSGGSFGIKIITEKGKI